LDLHKRFYIIKGHHTKITTIFLLTIIMLPVAAVGMTGNNSKANGYVLDLCERFGASCLGQTSLAHSPSEKSFTAIFLQYVNLDSQIEIYRPNMDNEDSTLLRATNGGIEPEYVQASLSLPGPAGVSFISSQQILDNAKKVKDLGFTSIEFNLEPDLSPDSDNNDVVGAMKKAADAAHQQGLEFVAAPSQAYTTNYGPQIAPFTDYYHIQAQSLQESGVKAYSEYVHAIVPKLKGANSNLEIGVQVSTKQDNAPGSSLLNTLKQCTDSVIDVADSVYVWYGSDDLRILESFIEWYKAKY
jgi:hypothetical protein